MAAASTATSTGASDGRSLGEIVGDLSTDLTTLVKQELTLARTELKEEAAKAGKGAGMLGGAGVAGLLALLGVQAGLPRDRDRICVYVVLVPNLLTVKGDARLNVDHG